MTALKFLAFDFGASSGRAILGFFSGSRIKLEEIHRFPNQPVKVLGHLYWDLLNLFTELKQGLIETSRRGHRELAGIGVDTWGVDFGLVGPNNQLLGNPYCYRDERTKGMMEKAGQYLRQEELYNYTGIQFMPVNTIYQLLSMRETSKYLLEAAEKLLFMPDLFNFLLTGEKLSEYTIASTSQLLNARTRSWEPAIFDKLNLPFHLMAPIIEPGSVIGPLLPEVVTETGLQPAEVIAPACHDTASAVAAVPTRSPRWAYLSSGTWSLIGLEIDEPIISQKSLHCNFTNEGGVGRTIRFLHNTMGLWLWQRCLAKWNQAGADFSYDQLIRLAEQAPPFKCLINVDDLAFLNPPDMPQAMAEFCRKTGQTPPQNEGEFTRCIFESLALRYRYLLDKLSEVSGQPIEVLHIIGGGSQNELLNQFTANATRREVVAGLAEATALGNILIQAMARQELASLEEARELVVRSFSLKRYSPREESLWEEMYQKAKSLFWTE